MTPIEILNKLDKSHCQGMDGNEFTDALESLAPELFALWGAVSGMAHGDIRSHYGVEELCAAFQLLDKKADKVIREIAYFKDLNNIRPAKSAAELLHD